LGICAWSDHREGNESRGRFHLRGWHWPAFNIADIVIVSGAAALVLRSLVKVEGSGAAPKEAR